MNKKIRFLTGILTLFIISGIGYFRETYLIDLTGHEAFIHSRADEARYLMPASIDDVDKSFTGNPKWVSSLIYSIVYMGLSALSIWCIFLKKTYVFSALFIHMLIIFMAGMFILTGLINHSFNRMYIAAEYLKNLLQSPLLSLILISGFLLMKDTLKK